MDLSRLAVYGASLPLQGATTRPALLLITILAALAGTFLASRYIAAIRMETIRKLIAVMLIGIALGLGSGIISRPSGREAFHFAARGSEAGTSSEPTRGRIRTAEGPRTSYGDSA